LNFEFNKNVFHLKNFDKHKKRLIKVLILKSINLCISYLNESCDTT